MADRLRADPSAGRFLPHSHPRAQQQQQQQQQPHQQQPHQQPQQQQQQLGHDSLFESAGSPASAAFFSWAAQSHPQSVAGAVPVPVSVPVQQEGENATNQQQINGQQQQDGGGSMSARYAYDSGAAPNAQGQGRAAVRGGSSSDRRRRESTGRGVTGEQQQHDGAEEENDENDDDQEGGSGSGPDDLDNTRATSSRANNTTRLSGSGSGGVPHKKGGGRPRHYVWTFFTETTNSRGRRCAECNHCGWTSEVPKAFRMRTHVLACDDIPGPDKARLEKAHTQAEKNRAINKKNAERKKKRKLRRLSEKGKGRNNPSHVFGEQDSEGDSEEDDEDDEEEEEEEEEEGEDGQGNENGGSGSSALIASASSAFHPSSIFSAYHRSGVQHGSPSTDPHHLHPHHPGGIDPQSTQLKRSPTASLQAYAGHSRIPHVSDHQPAPGFLAGPAAYGGIGSSNTTPLAPATAGRNAEGGGSKKRKYTKRKDREDTAKSSSYNKMAPPGRSPITCHVLDSSAGRPGGGIKIRMEQLGQTGFTHVADGVTDADGRNGSLLAAGSKIPKNTIFKLTFYTRDYFDAKGIQNFYPFVEVVFEVGDPSEHHHIALLVSPFSYTTYRGS